MVKPAIDPGIKERLIEILEVHPAGLRVQDITRIYNKKYNKKHKVGFVQPQLSQMKTAGFYGVDYKIYHTKLSKSGREFRWILN